MGKHLVTNFLASLTSLAIPIVLYGLIAATSTNPDGSPDNALIRLLPFYAVVWLVLLLPLMGYFAVLAWWQNKQKEPRLKLVFLMSALAASPFLLLLFVTVVLSGVPMTEFGQILLAAVIWFGLPFLSLFLGGLVQWKRMRSCLAVSYA